VNVRTVCGNGWFAQYGPVKHWVHCKLISHPPTKLACVRYCVWPIILDAELYTTCPREGVLVVMIHQVQRNIPTSEAVIRKSMHLFLERCRSTNVMVACFAAVRLFIFFLIPWTVQPHFTLWLSARTLQCLFVWGCACHNAFVLYLGLTRN